MTAVDSKIYCSSGDRPEILQANSELLDLAFLQAGEGVADNN